VAPVYSDFSPEFDIAAIETRNRARSRCSRCPRPPFSSTLPPLPYRTASHLLPLSQSRRKRGIHHRSPRSIATSSRPEPPIGATVDATEDSTVTADTRSMPSATSPTPRTAGVAAELAADRPPPPFLFLSGELPGHDRGRTFLFRSDGY
jgi:hypothetical protein